MEQKVRGEEAKQMKLPKGMAVTKQEFLEAVRVGVHDAMRAQDRVLPLTALLPCVTCYHGAKALEEVVAVYAALLHGERPPRELADRPLPYLPRACCKQAKASTGTGAQVATDAIVAKTA
jgi:hypothetical protein